MSENAEVKIERIKLGEAKFPDYNPRVDVTLQPKFHESLKKSLDRFGYVEPVVWNRRTGNIVGGNQRAKVLLEKGVSEADVIVVDVDEVTEKAMNVALNKITGTWDKEKLGSLLDELSALPELLPFTGFSKDEVDKLTGSLDEEVTLQRVFEVVVECSDEEMQKTVFEQLKKEGYTCRVLTI